MDKIIETIPHEEYIKPKREALAKHLGCDLDELSEQKYDQYGLSCFEYGNEEYAVEYDAECDEACENYIEQTAWAFNPSFICEQCELPVEMEEEIKALQEKCESANDSILALIKKCGNLKEFTEAAIGADGRGHFLSGYDGHEIELENNLYAYRTN